MPIQHMPGGTTMITGDSITFAQLVAQRGAVYLELQGLRVRRGRKLWPALADRYQIRPRTAKAVFEWLEAKVAELRPQQEHVDEHGRRLVGGEEVQ